MEGNTNEPGSDEITIHVTPQMLQDIRRALYHAMQVEFGISRTEMHQGPHHEQSRVRYIRYEKLYTEITDALEQIG